MRQFLPLLIIGSLTIAAADAVAIDPYAGNDPYWVLLHEPAVIEELKLSPEQNVAYLKLLDEQDSRFFPLRNRSDEDAQAGMDLIKRHVQEQLQTILEKDQTVRLNEILMQFLGNAAMLRDDVRARVGYTDSQRARMKEIVQQTESSLTTLTEKRRTGKSAESFEKAYLELKTEEQRKLLSVLKPEQQVMLKSIYGPPFRQKDLRQPRFKAPELVDTGDWINSPPVELKQFRGKVIVLHFYACGCINCIHNYPSYRQWQADFKDREVVLLGIHTPETKSERDTAHVRRRAVDEKLSFPILIDGQKENWNAWGNSMWPSVYVIDKQGYLRDFWAGELKWQGQDGEQYLRDRIQELLKERILDTQSQASRRNR